MKATSVQNIKNVKDVSFLLAEDPDEMGSNFTIIARTNDDIFKFEFEGGLDLLQSCKAAGLFTGWEKDQKIRELEKELSAWRNGRYKEEVNKLKQQLKEEKEKLEDENKDLRIQVKVLEDIKRENAELKDKLLKVLWTVADCEINKGGYKDE